MTLIEAKRLVDLSRQAHWAYPTSFGRPVHWDKTEKWVKTLDQERSSFVSAAEYLIQIGQEELAWEIAANVWRLWILAKDGDGGRRFLAEVLDHGSSQPWRWRALALYGDSLLAMRQGKLEDSRKRSEEALKIAELTKDVEALVFGNLAMSRVAMEDGNYQEARDRSSDALRYARDLGAGWWQAPLFMQAQSYRMLGDYEEAALLFGESLDLNRRIEDKGMVIAELTNLGLVEIHRNNVERAEQLLDEAEKLTGSAPDDPYGKAMTSLNKAMLAYRKNDIAQARSLLSEAKSIFAEAKIDPATDDKSEIDWLDHELASITG